MLARNSNLIYWWSDPHACALNRRLGFQVEQLSARLHYPCVCWALHFITSSKWCIHHFWGKIHMHSTLALLVVIKDRAMLPWSKLLYNMLVPWWAGPHVGKVFVIERLILLPSLFPVNYHDTWSSSNLLCFFLLDHTLVYKYHSSSKQTRDMQHQLNSLLFGYWYGNDTIYHS